MTVRIEQLEPDDWRRWRDVRSRALALDPTAFACSAHRLGPRTPEDQWRERIASAEGIFLAVDDAGEDVGMVGLSTADAPELISMWVAPQARRHGVGHALVDAVVARAGRRPLSLRVMADNAAGIAFYAGCGFELVGREPDDEGTLTMRRDAPSAATAWPAPTERPPRPGAPRPGRSADQ
ncbi:GNAT family N-acetyltransferase [Aeromicrobium senzhongii]|uniref:GNAT family N-acetyltransferase n=1 Tax=Aeromicrobium senzhongii TaxID=2663859 RepID=A0A8I0JYJ3_9ACTN|nr:MULTISPECIES: GNAT family N-acetyltransferase [Aeromicrobium]MBC9224932.1 GNAT family N-acetyltransferase [Aeromicrobium senzhongii]QNL93195.1 GNAT family N-acetyltransferase [Aeromicrobium senzhongii]